MRKILISTMLILAILTISVMPAFANTFAHAVDYVGAKNYYGVPASKGALIYAMVEQTSYRFGNDPTRAGTQCNYGGRKTKTTAGTSIFTVLKFFGDSGISAAGAGGYNTSVALNSDVYLIVNPTETNSNEIMRVVGSWQP